MTDNTHGDIVELSMDSVTLIDGLVASGQTDEATLETLERNARHLEIIVQRESLNDKTKSSFKAAIAKARSLVE